MLELIAPPHKENIAANFCCIFVIWAKEIAADYWEGLILYVMV